MKLKGQKMQPMRPWYRGHRGQITKGIVRPYQRREKANVAVWCSVADSAGGGWVSHGVARVKPASGRGKKSGSGAVVEVGVKCVTGSRAAADADCVVCVLAPRSLILT